MRRESIAKRAGSPRDRTLRNAVAAADPPRARGTPRPAATQGMVERSKLSLKKEDLLWILLSLVLLLPTLYYPYVKSRENSAFSLSPGDWSVVAAAPCAAASCLQAGDRVLAIGKLDFGTFARHRNLELLSGFDGREVGPVTVLRHGRILTLSVRARRHDGGPGGGAASGPLPVVLWLMR